MFSRHGLPLEVCSDNGSQFCSLEFVRFADLYELKHATSSREFPRSNDLAEKVVQFLKSILKQSSEDVSDTWWGH